MKRPAKPPGNKCPQGDARTECPLQCRYNHFEKPGENEGERLTIDAWEIRCLDCGYRDTIAFRSDDDPPPEDPRTCPYCDLSGLCPGRNPCERPGA